jgi:hypothetical protein
MSYAGITTIDGWNSATARFVSTIRIVSLFHYDPKSKAVTTSTTFIATALFIKTTS